MDQQEVREFVEAFFQHRKCDLLRKDQNLITVRLTPETDKDLGYRPFYWSYVESMGMKPELLEITYLFQPQEVKELRTEPLLFGSPRLKAIFEATKKKGRFIRLYEEVPFASKKKPLDPWLFVNYKVEYLSDLKRDKLLSFGLHLGTGRIIEDFFSRILSLPLNSTLSPHLFLTPPRLTIREAAFRLEERILSLLRAEGEEWADEARRRLEAEKKQTLQYYERRLGEIREKGKREEEENFLQKVIREREKRLRELEWQYSPHIEVNPINQGILYLLPTSLSP
ncbi:YqhG family protein [Thermicanus aegyptius]|uniref:YqhG family protein n=1 Tax=Thermicanus aegyptius TaxID=94009 RepID=UPI000409F7EE|nr:YqhG family protein [Thermicanus aegyptius]